MCTVKNKNKIAIIYAKSFDFFSHLWYNILGKKIFKLLKNEGREMFSIGEKIVYPLHGAGIVEAIEQKEILGKKKKYYVMRVYSGNMTVLIPVDNCEEIGVRQVIDKTEAKKVVEYFKTEPLYDDDNWNRRQRENMVKLKSGDIYKVLDVLKDLLYRDKLKGLSTSERKALVNARQIIVSELVMSGFAGAEDIELIMDSIIDGLIKSEKG